MLLSYEKEMRAVPLAARSAKQKEALMRKGIYGNPLKLDPLALRLESKLSDLRAGDANPRDGKNHENCGSATVAVPLAARSAKQKEALMRLFLFW